MLKYISNAKSFSGKANKLLTNNNNATIKTTDKKIEEWILDLEE